MQSVRLAAISLVLASGGWMAAGGVSASAATPVQDAMFEKVNATRAANGLQPLRPAPVLFRSARRYARWMMRRDYFGHLGRIRTSGRFALVGENLEWHTGKRPRVAGTVQAWLESPGHRALMLDTRFRWLGTGMAYGRMKGWASTTWVLHFGG